MYLTNQTKKGFLSRRDFNKHVFVTVLAFCQEIRSFIQGRVWVSPQNGQFFCQAQSAVHCAATVGFGFANDEPFYD